MEYTFYTEPVTFCIIKNFYTKDEVTDIHDELTILQSKLIPGEKTGTARNVVGHPRKDNNGLFLDEFYDSKDSSVILKLNRKIFTPEVKYELAKGNWFFKYLSDTKFDSTLVSYYREGDYYKSHEDQSFLTAIYYTWKEPKTFKGGHLYFGDFKVPIENNCLLIFPSKTEHSVSKLRSGEGRWAISQFISMDSPKTERRLPVDKFENFLSVTDFNKVNSHVFSGNWRLEGRSVDGPATFWYQDLSSDPFFTDYLFKKICELCELDFKLKRVYANGHTYTQNGSYHQDDTEPNTFTFLMYLNQIDPNDLEHWGGETQFKCDEGHVSFLPATNSALLFDSRVWHRGMGPSRNVKEMRVTIAWKLSR